MEYPEWVHNSILGLFSNQISLRRCWLGALKPLNRIQNKLLVAFLVVVLLPLIGTGLYGNWITSRVLQESALNNAKNDTTQPAEQITAFPDNAQEDILFLSELGSVRALIAARRSIPGNFWERLPTN